MSHINEFIKNEFIITLLLINKKFSVGFYVFRDPYITYNGKKSILMIFSLMMTQQMKYSHWVSYSIKYLNNKTKKIIMTDSGHNNIILNIILKKYKIITILMGSYYFYNYIHTSSYEL